MLQRIQTLYLLASIIVIGIIAYLLQQQTSIMEGTFALAVMAALCTIFILHIITILMFKNRKVQGSLLLFSFILQFITIAAMTYGMIQMKYPILAPLCITSAVIICTILARKGILADEKLVRSMDRLR